MEEYLLLFKMFKRSTSLSMTCRCLVDECQHNETVDDKGFILLAKTVEKSCTGL
jgi:hypothetical protein